ncbi:hypothetical protein GEV33_012554 [Tenebrio molitor]|jgi:hypothetical protein|uniref:Uncharacterized protein n=1 Tax=Tenebrio molitor TaxID=7067 RepID=A0A8J6H9I2_TENMO|nr:hypothetical protein GEV33_012554 [Tenebrio molitor]
MPARTSKQQQNGRLPLHHAVKDKQENRERGSTVHIITADRGEIANRMGRSWAPGATRARTAPYIIDWRLEGPPEPPRQHCLRTILYAGTGSVSIGFYKFIMTIFYLEEGHERSLFISQIGESRLGFH